jgi:hypothetical protein
MKNIKSLTGADFSFLIGISVVVGMLVVGFIAG